VFYRCKHFDIRELVSPVVWQQMGERAWTLFDPALLQTLDQIREKFGVMWVNTWHWGGQYSQRGLRSAAERNKLISMGIWKPYSQHMLGRAIDCHFKDVTVKYAREYILAHPAEFPHIKGVEIANWLHIDTRNSEKVVVFNAN
jgi:uncharacterized protein YcbK (DUF882 family)